MVNALAIASRHVTGRPDRRCAGCSEVPVDNRMILRVRVNGGTSRTDEVTEPRRAVAVACDALQGRLLDLAVRWDAVDGDVGRGLGGEVRAGPVRVPGLQVEPGQLRHEVGFGGPDVTVRAAQHPRLPAAAEAVVEAEVV